MKKLYLLFLVFSCAPEKETIINNVPVFESIQYITLTNENTDGGSQIAFHLSGIGQNSMEFCYCQELCQREFIVVSELEFNRDTTEYRYKINLDDEFQTASSSDWCTLFN